MISASRTPSLVISIALQGRNFKEGIDLRFDIVHQCKSRYIAAFPPMSNHIPRAELVSYLMIRRMNGTDCRSRITLFIRRDLSHELPRGDQNSDHDRCGYHQHIQSLWGRNYHTLYNPRRQKILLMSFLPSGSRQQGPTLNISICDLQLYNSTSIDWR